MSKKRDTSGSERSVLRAGEFAARESRKHCPKCRATEGDIINTIQLTLPRRTVRYRRCLTCGQRYGSVEPLE